MSVKDHLRDTAAIHAFVYVVVCVCVCVCVRELFADSYLSVLFAGLRFMEL